MKSFLLIFALSFFSANTFGQSEKIDSKAIADIFEKNITLATMKQFFQCLDLRCKMFYQLIKPKPF